MPLDADSSLPLRIGTAEQFACVRRFLRETYFDEASVCSSLGLQSMSDLRRASWDEAELLKLSPGLRFCFRVFLRGEPFPKAGICPAVGEEAFESLIALGLLRPSKNDASQVVCPVWLYPVDSFVVTSDRPSDPDGEPYAPPPDVVFPAIYGGTLRFLELMPSAPGGEALDLCGGSGIGALRLSKTARTAVTADITPRSALFADFNARLNDASVSSLCGDLYAPVSGRQFDLVTAHPPFVPALGQDMVYRDGGETGEDITRRVIEGLPSALRPGGTCMVLCVGRDTEDKPFEQRVREWLGESAPEFDIVFGLEKVLQVSEVIDSMRKRGQHFGEQECRQLTERLRSSKTSQFVYGAAFLRRCDGWQPPPPLRLHLSVGGKASQFEKVLAWRRLSGHSDFGRRLASSRPRLSSDVILTVRHVVQHGELVPADCVFSVDAGLGAALRPDSWVVPLIARLQGRQTVSEIFEQARRADELPKGFTFDAFAGLVGLMVERGLVEVDLPQ